MQSKTYEWLQYNVIPDVLERMENKIYEVDGRGIYPFDLCSAITEDEQNNESWYCSTALAIDELGRKFSFFSNFYNDYVSEYTTIDALLNPEKAHCDLMVALYYYIANKYLQHNNRLTNWKIYPEEMKVLFSKKNKEKFLNESRIFDY